MSNASENQTIGPYRVIGSLGKGGMGEVLLAKDPRLHRKVAIKQIRGGEHPEARQRFQREARLAASLSHASIVSIFDFVEQEDHEYLVMELVDGPSLKAWLEGEVSFEEKLRVAEQIAAGLQYAHRFGVVHRDLKTENVLITPEGQAKIADFGIARRFRATDEMAGDETADANTRDRTELLTREGALIGTYRSMSPEQAQGERADFRSDLFSFGVLLYEMFAGLSPFLAEKPLDTLFNLVSRPHPDLDQVAPGLPRPLVRLIDQLLEKDRDLRPRSADEVLQQLRQVRRAVEEEDGATIGKVPLQASHSRSIAPRGSNKTWRYLGWSLPLLALVAGSLVYWLQPPPRIEVAVLRPKCKTEPCPPNLENDIRAAIEMEVSSLRRVTLKSSSEVDSFEKETFREIFPKDLAKALGLDEVIETTLVCSAVEKCGYKIDRWNAAIQGTVKVDEAELYADTSFGIYGSIGASIKNLYPNLSSSRIDLSKPDSNSLVQLKRELATAPSVERLKEMLDELHGIKERVGHYVIAINLEVEISQRIFRVTNERNYVDGAIQILEEALEAEPDDPLPLMLAQIWQLTSLDEIDRAEVLLAEAEAAYPNDFDLTDTRAYLLEMKGEVDEAVSERRLALERKPSWNRRLALAHALVAAHEWEQARTTLQDLLAEAKSFRSAEILRARIELLVGDAPEAIARYRNILKVAEDPGTLSELATAHILHGDGDQGAQEIEKALRFASENPYLFFTLAEARMLQGRRAEAVQLFERVISILEAEPEWQQNSANSLTTRAQAYAYLGKLNASHADSSKAANLMNRLIINLPKAAEGRHALEAALVFTLANEQASSTLQIQQLKKQGQGGWLCLPPFQESRLKTEFSALIDPCPRLKV